MVLVYREVRRACVGPPSRDFDLPSVLNSLIYFLSLSGSRVCVPKSIQFTSTFRIADLHKWLHATNGVTPLLALDPKLTAFLNNHLSRRSLPRLATVAIMKQLGIKFMSSASDIFRVFSVLVHANSSDEWHTVSMHTLIGCENNSRQLIAIAKSEEILKRDVTKDVTSRGDHLG